MTNRRLFWAIVLGGAAVRLIPYLARPSLSYDETMLALSIARRSFAGLLTPLDYRQTAPVVYLWLARLAVLGGGVSELALRLPSLLAGLVVPVAGFRVARRLWSEGPANFAAGVLAFAPGVAQYSVIVKPYELDALVTLVILDRTLAWQDHPDSHRAWWTLTAAGVVGVFASATAALVLAGAGLALLLRGNRVRAFLVLVIWSAAFVAAYLLIYGVYRRTGGGAYMQTYWAADFLTPGTYAPGGRAWGVLSHSFVEALVLRPVPDVVAFVVTALVVMGLWRVGRARGWSGVALLAGPVGATMVASVIRLYPFNWRLLLFTVPLVALLLAAVFAWGVGEGFGPRVRRGVAAAAAIVLLALLAVNISHPYRTAPVRELVRTWSAGRTRGEPIYLLRGAIPAWGMYATDWRTPDSRGLDSLAAWVDGAPADEVVGGPDSAVVIGRPSGIVWRVGVGAGHARPDSGWASHEVQRLARVAGPSGGAWLLLTQGYGSEIEDVRATLARAGAHELSADGGRGGMLLHVTFPRNGS